MASRVQLTNLFRVKSYGPKHTFPGTGLKTLIICAFACDLGEMGLSSSAWITANVSGSMRHTLLESSTRSSITSCFEVVGISSNGGSSADIF